MRKSLIAFAFTAVVTTTSLLHAQTSSQSFPWRTSSGVQPLVHPDLLRGNQRPVSPEQARVKSNSPVEPGLEQPEGYRVAQNQTPRLREGSTFAAVAPTKKRNPIFVAFSHQQEQEQDQGLGDAQPSVSDVTQERVTDSIPRVDEPTVAPRLIQNPAAPYAESVVQPPMTTPIAAPEPMNLVVSNATDVEPNYCDRDCRKSWCNLGCERKLFGTSPRGLEVGGWTALGYHNRNNIMLNNRKGEANLDQAWLYFDKAASQDGPNWDLGFRADLLYGIDAQDLQAFGNPPAGAATGWDNSWDYGSYGWALPQLYVQFANDTWDVKLGKFFSPFGYEKVAAPDNFFYSHSYTMYYSEPRTMSGVLAERTVSNTRSQVFGVTAGWDTGFESDTGGCLITGQRFQPNEYVNIALTTCFGDRGRRGIGALNSGVARVQLTEDLNYVFQGDYLDFGTNQEFGIVQYLFRDVTECVALGARLEWWKSDQLFNNTKSTYEFTMGANLKPNANITIRPEVRFDWGAAAIDPGEAIIGLDVMMTF